MPLHEIAAAPYQAIYPDELRIAPIVSLEKAVSLLAGQPDKVFASLERTHRPLVLEHRDQGVREFANAEDISSRARAICFGALLGGSLVAYAKGVASPSLYEIKLDVWQGRAIPACHPLVCKRRSKNPSVKQPSRSVAPE